MKFRVIKKGSVTKHLVHTTKNGVDTPEEMWKITTVPDTEYTFDADSLEMDKKRNSLEFEIWFKRGKKTAALFKGMTWDVVIPADGEVVYNYPEEPIND